MLSSSNNITSASLIHDKVIIQDEKGPTTAGGTFIKGDWRTRDLNTLYYNQQTTETPWCTLSSNQFTLTPGIYQVTCIIPAFVVNFNNIRIRNITTGNSIYGAGDYAGAVNNCSSTCFLSDILTINSNNTLVLQHTSESDKNSNGFGVETNNEVNNIYSQIEITKLK